MAISAQHTRFETNEYISALPAEDLIKVATKKQEMYDEGRFKIKQTIDNYGKLRNSMVSDVHKNYLDQEINKLTKNIQNNAGLDFANIGNVEAVLNLAKPFENDQYIRIGLNNGIVAQQRFADLNALPKESRNADNDALFLKDYNKMLESGGLDTKLNPNKRYEEYVDIKKELAAIEKEVKGKMETAYAQGPRGYFEKIDIEKKTAQEVYDRAMLSMSPAQQRQLQIHAEAEMDRLGPNAVYQTWIGHSKQEKLVASETLKKAYAEKGRLDGLRVKTAADKATLNEVGRIISDTQSTINAIDQAIQMNPDDFDMQEYVPFFSKRFISGFAQGFAYETKKTDLKEDKVYMSQMEHQQSLSRIAVQARETRTTAQFTDDLKYDIVNTVSIGNLSSVPRLLSNSLSDKDRTELQTKIKGAGTKQGEIQVIGQYLDKLVKDRKITNVLAEKYKRDLTQLSNAYDAGGNNSKVVLNRSRGTGRAETSWNDFSKTSILDIMSMGNTLELLSPRINVASGTTKGAAAKATPQQKGIDKANTEFNYLVTSGLLRGMSQKEAEEDAEAIMAAKAGKSKAKTSLSGLGLGGGAEDEE